MSILPSQHSVSSEPRAARRCELPLRRAVPTTWAIDDQAIADALEAGAQADVGRAREVLARAAEGRGLSPSDVAVLAQVRDRELDEQLFVTARAVKERIYGRRLVLFAPLYVSNHCTNECSYCAFRVRNRAIERRALTQEEIAREVRTLVEQGHKRILLVAGEAYPNEGLRYVLDAVNTIYATRSERGEIRRVNVNIAPLDVEGFRRLHECRIGTYQLFQETYHRPTYQQVHLAGPKRNYQWRLEVMDRAMQGGIEDVGIGALFGLYDWRYELLALLAHARHLEERFGVGPHTVSVPRIEPATGSPLASTPPHAVSDHDFRRIIALLRLALPYTGIILSTRESAVMRQEAFSLGVSQISAGSRTCPGGYASPAPEGATASAAATAASAGLDAAQFSLGDHRSLDEVIHDVASLGYVPSFCTACYRLGRTGRDFMDLAKPGEIRHHCDPNALSTLTEYLEDYASPETKRVGQELVRARLGEMEASARRVAERLLTRVCAGRRDVLV